MVQYSVNPEEVTIEEVWSFGEKRGEVLYSKIVGDANYHSDTGNRMLTSGYIEVEDGRNSRVTEVNNEQPADVIYKLVISEFKSDTHRQAYRAFRLPMYPQEN